ncbi:MAG: tRNA nucleotidyltransferase, partial [Dehalococcoidia bacterium]|nr:tRNA nucleotidyltransferase [Dehalococcoidia bacterium]
MRVSLVQDAQRVAVAVREAGGRALCVGGFVRDRLLQQPSEDLDLEVFGIPEDRLRSLLATLGRVEPVGQAF